MHVSVLFNIQDRLKNAKKQRGKKSGEAINDPQSKYKTRM